MEASSWSCGPWAFELLWILTGIWTPDPQFECSSTTNWPMVKFPLSSEAMSQCCGAACCVKNTPNPTLGYKDKSTSIDKIWTANLQFECQKHSTNRVDMEYPITYIEHLYKTPKDWCILFVLKCTWVSVWTDCCFIHFLQRFYNSYSRF